MTENVTYVSPEAVTIAVLTPVAKNILRQIGSCQDFNDLPDIPWYLREAVRSVQGHLDKADDLILEMFGRIATEESEDAITEIWGPL